MCSEHQQTYPTTRRDDDGGAKQDVPEDVATGKTAGKASAKTKRAKLKSRRSKLMSKGKRMLNESRLSAYGLPAKKKKKHK